MRKISFVVFIIGMVTISFYLNLEFIEIEKYSDMDDLVVNQRVYIEGKVIFEKDLFGDHILFNIGEIEIICECEGNFEGKFVEVEGFIEEYNGRKQVRVLRIIRV